MYGEVNGSFVGGQKSARRGLFRRRLANSSGNERILTARRVQGVRPAVTLKPRTWNLETPTAGRLSESESTSGASSEAVPDAGCPRQERQETEGHVFDGGRPAAQRALQTVARAIEQTADSVFITTRHGTIEYVNPAFEGLTGFTAQEAIGANPRIVQSGRHDAAFYTNLWTTILSGRVFRSVITNRRKDGALYEEDQTITPVRDTHAQVTHFIATGRDATERIRTAEALRRLNNQLELEATRIAGILHDEAGQFLTSAHLTLSDLTREAPPTMNARLQALRKDIDRVGAQLRRVSHEMHPSLLDDFGLLNVIQIAADAFVRRTGVRLEVEGTLDPPCPPHIRTVLYRFVQEALTNMGKHARAGTGRIVLTREGTCIQCSVVDDGRGFDVAAATRPETRGLGLTIIQDRLEAVGGTLEILSSPGHGTELRTIIPEES